MQNNLLRVCLIFVYLLLVGCKEDLVHLGNELDANRVLFVLRDRGIEASKTSIGKEWVVRIAKTDLTLALRVLEEKKLFQEQADGLGQTSSNVFQSKEEKKDFRDKDLSRGLSSSIRLIPLVKEARVHIYNKFNDPLELNPQNERSASVLIVHDQGEVSEEVVKELVSRGAGLLKEKVSVLFVFAEVRKDEVLNVKERSILDLPHVESQVSARSNFSFEWAKLKLSKYLDVYDTLILAPCLILLMFFLFKKLKLKRKAISRADILDKLNKERLRNEST